MVALKKAEIEPFLTRPDPRRPLVLIYGPDLGLVRERAEALLRAAAPEGADPFSVVALEGDAVAADPGRLIDEARTIGLFGARRVIRVRAGARNLADALKPMLAQPPEGALVVIEAGDLRKNAPLRTLCEASPAVAVIPCYADGADDLARLIERTLAPAKIRIDPDAEEALIELLGADRLATRAELEKLVLYAGNCGRIGLHDVQAVIADASALALDDVVDAAAAGDEETALAALEKTRAAGTAATTVIGAAIRHVGNLHRLSLEIERGTGVAKTVERAQPPIHFRRKPRIERALARLGSAALAETLIALGQGSLAARRQPALADAIVERAILQLARGGKRRGRGAA